MKYVVTGLLVAFATSLIACGGANDPTGQSSEELSGSSSIGAPRSSVPPVAHDPSTTPPPSTTHRSTAPSTSSAGSVVIDPICPPGERPCHVEESDARCKIQCVKDTVFCVAPKACATVSCDVTPSAAPPRAGCVWDTTACHYDCPVCDPVGTPPHAGCTWSSTACDWDCPVCDPVGPPPYGGCKWDTKTCVWLCV